MTDNHFDIPTLWALVFMAWLGIMSLIAIVGGNRAKHRRAERARTGKLPLRDRLQSEVDRIEGR
jgi:hypothetical protein